MKKLTFVLTALLLFAAIGAGNARADSYTATFSCSASPVAGGCPLYAFPSAPSVSFSSSTSMPITIGAGAGGVTALFSISLPAADSPTDAYTWSFFSSGDFQGHSSDSVSITDNTTNLVSSTTVSNDNGFSLPFCGDLDFGSLTFSLANTNPPASADPPTGADAPEPSGMLLMLAGIGLLAFFARKRLVLRLARTA